MSAPTGVGEELRKKVLSCVANSKYEATTLDSIASMCDCSSRVVKKAIQDLRAEYPICSKESGGYWLAQDRAEMREFIAMMVGRRNAMTRTIVGMHKFIRDSEDGI